MEEMTLGKIARWVQGTLMHASRNLKINGAAIDSRQVKPGNLFVALPGKKNDGHDFVEAAMAAGAAAGLVQRAVGDFPVLVVKDPRKALGDLAAGYRRLFPGLKTVAVTGSSGKTSTKEMLASILSRRSTVLESQGNFNNDLGLPLTLLKLSAKDQVAVLEMGMNAAGEIRRLAQIAQPAAGIITNIGEAHIGNFRNQQALARAKLELLAELEKDAMGVLNLDNAFLAKAAKTHPRVLTFGMNPQADIRVAQVGVHLSGTRVQLEHARQKAEIQMKVMGAHQAWNAAAAVAGAMALGASFQAACQALEGFKPKAPMRMELLRVGQHRVIHDAYNSNPQSAAAALQLLAELPTPGKKIFVAGSMLELGERSVEAHHELGHLAAMAGVDGLITVGSEAHSVAAGARTAGGVRWTAKLDSVHEVLENLKPHLSVQGDLILVKGSRGIGLEVFVEALKHWAGK